MQARLFAAALAALIAAMASVLGASGIAAGTTESENQRSIRLAEALFKTTNPKAAYDRLSPADRESAMRALRPDPTQLSLTTSYTPAPQSSPTNAAVPSALTAVTTAKKCWSVYKKWEQNSSAGNTLYTYWMGLKWCGQSGKVSNVNVYTRGGETATPGWRYMGHGGSGANNVGWEVRRYVQEKFQFGLNGWDVIVANRCGQIRGGATGLYSTRQNCDL